MTTNPTCASCGHPMPALLVNGQPRTYCTSACRMAMLVRKRVEFAEDVEWLLDQGESASAVTSRMGCNSEAIGRRLRRAGRGDLARAFEGLNARHRPRRACVNCGGTCVRARCFTCAIRVRDGRARRVAA